MTWGTPLSGQTIKTRPAPSSHVSWNPLPYMERAVEFLTGHYVAGLPLKPGGRKTSITLAAFLELKRTGQAQTMLVIAPLRVCRQTWRQEGKKWTQFKNLNFALLHGPKKLDALKSGADVYLINPEGVAWLCARFPGRSLPFDVVCIDELTKFQNGTAERHKALQPRLKSVPFRWGLTGSLFSKGHMSIFGQQKILDDGAALGRFITHYRDKYFQVGFDGFSYDLLPGAERRIAEAIAPYWFYMDEADYSELPPLVDVPRIAQMSKGERAVYTQMKTKMLADLPDGRITAANAGACYSKLAQMANGAIYDEQRGVHHIHDLKLEMLDELFDELAGEPLLVAYEYNHDLERIQEWYLKKTGDKLPYLGKGTTTKQEDQWIADWNQRRLPLLLAHPQSAGHGLNMQEGQAYNVAWFSVTWDWELFDQFIRRVRRSGNLQSRIFNHLLIIEGTIDELKLAAVAKKDFTERGLITALNTQILGEMPKDQPSTNGDIRMVAKLSRPGAAAEPTQQAQQGGWGAGGGQQQRQEPEREERAPQTAQGGWGAQGGGNQEQRERIQERIAPDRSQAARNGFSGEVAQQMDNFQSADYGEVGGTDRSAPAGGKAGGWGAPTGQAEQPPFDGGTVAAEKEPPKTRASRSKAADPAPIIVGGTDPAQFEAEEEGRNARHNEMVRAQVLAAVITSSPDASIEELVESARSLMEFVERG